MQTIVTILKIYSIIMMIFVEIALIKSGENEQNKGGSIIVFTLLLPVMAFTILA